MQINHCNLSMSVCTVIHITSFHITTRTHYKVLQHAAHYKVFHITTRTHYKVFHITTCTHYKVLHITTRRTLQSITTRTHYKVLHLTTCTHYKVSHITTCTVCVICHCVHYGWDEFCGAVANLWRSHIRAGDWRKQVGTIPAHQLCCWITSAPTQFQLVLILQYITTVSTACIVTVCCDQIWCSDTGCIFRHITSYLAHHTLIGSGPTTSYYAHHTHITPSSTICVILNIG